MWEAPLWVVAMSLAMGAGAFMLSQVINRWHEGGKIPKDMSKWHEEVEGACFDVIRARVHVAEVESRLAELVGEVPADFHPALFGAADIASRMEEIMIKKAEAEGKWVERRFSSDKKETPSRESAPSNVVELTSHEFVAGQLLRKSG